MRTIGGHSAAHNMSRPWNMGRKRPPWTDVKYLHHATSRDAWMGIRKAGVIAGHGAERQTREEAVF
eukprot:8451359-Pyramimonas_sp.AAC.1